MTERLTITLDTETRDALRELMDFYGFESETQAAIHAIRNYQIETESAQRWMDACERQSESVRLEKHWNGKPRE